MRITVHPAASVETVTEIASFLLHDPFGSPVLVGLEYAMPEGTAWTFASADEDDFHKILGTSGILHTLIPGSRFGMSNLLCTPVLCRGVPRWFTDVDALLVCTDAGVPFFLARKFAPDRFRGIFHHDPVFKEHLSQLWNRRR